MARHSLPSYVPVTPSCIKDTMSREDDKKNRWLSLLSGNYYFFIVIIRRM